MIDTIAGLIAFAQSLFTQGVQFFNNTVNMLAHGDNGMKPVLSIFLLGVLAFGIRFLTRRIPMLVLMLIRKRTLVKMTIIDEESSDARNYSRFLEFFQNHKGYKKSRSLRLISLQGRSILGPGNGTHWFRLNRKLYWFRVEEIDSSGSEKQKSKLTIFTRGKDEHAFDYLNEQFAIKPPKELGFYSFSDSYRSGWGREGDLIPITIDDVIMPDELRNDLVKEIKWFMENEQWYRDRQLDYKLIILLHGKPGTGKSYLTRAIAHIVNRSLYAMATNSRDNEFRNSFRTVPDTGIILMEDFDDVKAVLKRTDDGTVTEHQRSVRSGDGPRLSTILNCLQGVNSSKGQIVVMTTNHLEVIDEAIYRDGRVDVLHEVHDLTHDLIVKYVARMYSPNEAALITETFKDTPASTLSKIFRKNPHNFEGFVAELKQRQGEEAEEVEEVREKTLKAA
jgi:hypothetical protein